MKFAGLFLLTSGFLLMACACFLLKGGAAQAVFAAVAFVMQLVGLGLACRGHYVSYEGQ
ncbi:MAG: hypothetical protein P4M01_05425 [Acidobacteriota bacterium]|nr:hypothetical protein [Acidobacteriota bacterium]